LPGFVPVCAGAGMTTPGNVATDGLAKIDGDSWALGWNAGVMVAVSKDTRVGLAYRSKLSHDIKGDATFTQPRQLPAPIAAAPAFTNGRFKAALTLPETLTLALHRDVSEALNLTASTTWTRWSRVRELRVKFDNGAPDAVTPFAWRNSWRAAAGAQYRLNSAWTLRGGVAYDQTPVSTAQRSPIIPDANRIMVGVGLSYRISASASIDAGYAHWFVHDATVNQNTVAGGTLAGTYHKPSIDAVSVQFNYRIQ
jgi:long-chain fatty acid transport protein